MGSALECWQASLDIPYIFKKAKYVPPADLPYYATRYLWNHLYRFVSREKRLAFWGPALDGMDVLLEKYSLTEICALQWKRCVDNAERDFLQIPADRIVRVSYEEFVHNPVIEFEKIANFIGREATEDIREHLKKNVRPDSVGKGRKALGAEQIASLRPLISDTLVRYGYE